MEQYRNEDGFIDISFIRPLRYLSKEQTVFFFKHNDIGYIYKNSKFDTSIYNELVAEELAKDFDIPCAQYDLAIFDDEVGVISKYFIEKNQTSYSMEILTRQAIKAGYINFNGSEIKLNNLEDIWNILEFKYKENEIVQKLMNQLVDIFLFDVLIANIDRHNENLIIVEDKDDIKFSKLFDNEGMLADNTIKNGEYFLGVDREDMYSEIDGDKNIFYKFLKTSDKMYEEKFRDKLWIISDENIESVLNRVEEKIKAQIPYNIKKDIKNGFRQNLKMINDQLEKNNERKLG